MVTMLLARLYVWAGDYDDEDVDVIEAIPNDLEEEELNDFVFGIGITDLLIFAVVIALFYVMSNSKLKKGCWYSVLYCILVALLIIKCT
jgi:hypothetical protein